MKQAISILLFGLLISVSGCKQAGKQNPDKEKDIPQKEVNSTKKEDIPDTYRVVYDIKAEDILKDFETWYRYTYFNIRLAQDFTGLDIDSNAVSKTVFLNLLITGKYIPLKINSNKGLPSYKLYKLDKKDQDIQAVIKQIANTEIVNYKMEGRQVPDFEFTDLNGHKYSKATTKGKILVLKCWFINCVACVEEFPELNKLVDEYKENNNILFVSLATDSKQKLVSFLQDRQFKYAVVPSSGKYMRESLEVNSYPTHFLIDKNGKIIKVVHVIHDLIPFLKKEAQKNNI